MMLIATIYSWVTVILLTVLVLAMGLTTARLLLGPSLADRVIALDVLIMASVGTLALTAVRYDVLAMLDVAVAVSLIAFIGTVGAGWYLERSTGA
jgi:multicomponent Na+:H+ antiporter subunit F